jgi:hypothetical protein
VACIPAPSPESLLPFPRPLQVYVPSHPLVKHWLAVARNKLSPPPVFRSALAELGRLLIYEATAQDNWLPVLEGQAETPCGVADVAFLDPGRPVKVRYFTLSYFSSHGGPQQLKYLDLCSSQILPNIDLAAREGHS